MKIQEKNSIFFEKSSIFCNFLYFEAISVIFLVGREFIS